LKEKLATKVVTDPADVSRISILPVLLFSRQIFSQLSTEEIRKIACENSVFTKFLKLVY
jgi:hypothetical protein